MQMKKYLIPPFWFLGIIVALPLFSETVYSPALPDIAKELQVSEAWVEHTLTIYLFGFAIGMLFWGGVSDKWGRKPTLLAGLGLYILGCMGCWMSGSIEILMISRFIQSLGGGACSVLGHSICRDSYEGAKLAKSYALIGLMIPMATAMGPVIGGFVAEKLCWQANFIVLTLCGILVGLLIYHALQETHQTLHKKRPPLKKILRELLSDPKEVAFITFIGFVTGSIFSYYAEGPFYMINILGISPSAYGMTFLGVASITIPSRYFALKLSQRFSPFFVLKKGIQLFMMGGCLFTGMTFLLFKVQSSPIYHIYLTLGCIMILMTSSGMILPNTMALALSRHRHAIGTASSIFGFLYYTLTSLVAMGMGILHNGTLFPMPIYFCVIGIIMWTVFRKCVEGKKGSNEKSV